MIIILQQFVYSYEESFRIYWYYRNGGCDWFSTTL